MKHYKGLLMYRYYYEFGENFFDVIKDIFIDLSLDLYDFFKRKL